MKFSRNIYTYLNGKQFSNALVVSLHGENSNARDRLDFIEKLATGRRILHVGFTDHLPLIREKAKSRRWLHGILLERAAYCAGIDIDGEAIEYCKTDIGIENIYRHDVINDDPLPVIAENQWDIAILAEVLEHIGNPVEFLLSLRKKYGHCIAKIVITVPNAWDIVNFLQACRGIEFINSDHRFWFTPYTLAKVGDDAGFDLIETYLVGTSVKNWMLRQLPLRYPMLRQSLIAVFEPRQ